MIEGEAVAYNLHAFSAYSLEWQSEQYCNSLIVGVLDGELLTVGLSEEYDSFLNDEEMVDFVVNSGESAQFPIRKTEYDEVIIPLVGRAGIIAQFDEWSKGCATDWLENEIHNAYADQLERGTPIGVGMLSEHVRRSC